MPAYRQACPGGHCGGLFRVLSCVSWSPQAPSIAGQRQRASLGRSGALVTPFLWDFRAPALCAVLAPPCPSHPDILCCVLRAGWQHPGRSIAPLPGAHHECWAEHPVRCPGLPANPQPRQQTDRPARVLSGLARSLGLHTLTQLRRKSEGMREL